MSLPEDAGVTSEPPSTAVAPSASIGPDPASESTANGQPVIVVPSISRPQETPTGMNTRDLVGYAIASEDRTVRLERLIYAVTGLLIVMVTLISAAAIVAFHYRIAGSVGLATAAIAAIGGPAAATVRRKRRERRDRRSTP
jgi:hypothetical protein